MTTPIATSTTDSQMHNNIMAAGSRDRPPMLATGRYAQWQSRFLRYIDTRPNDDALRKCILEGPYQLTTITIPAVPATDDTQTEAIHLLLTGIRDEIYSTVDACKIAHEMWIPIERLQQVATMQVNVQFLLQLQPEWSRFMTIIKQQHDLDTVSYHKLFEVLKQYQKEVNEIRAERIGKNANPLALVVVASPYPNPYFQAPKSHKPYAPTSKQSSSTRFNVSTKFKGKEIAKPITPPSESASEEDSDPEQAQRDKDMQKNLALIAKQSDCHFAKECMKPKIVKDSTYHKEKMLLCKQAEKGVPLQAEQSDWLADTDEEIDEQELEAHYSFMAKIQERQHSEHLESISNTCVVEKVDSNVIPDSPNMCDNDIQTDQNAEDERAALANLIANLKLDVDENKKIQKQLKKANTSLAHELKECKSILAETSRTLGESNSIRDSCRLERLVPDREETLTLEKECRSKLNKDLVRPYDYTKLNKLVDQAWEKHSHDHFRAPTAHDMEILIKTCLMPLAIKTQNDSFTFVHELKQEMHADLKYVESLEKEIDELESDKAEFSNMYDILLQECVSNDVMCSYLHSLSDLDAHTELQCLYLHKVKECECLAQKLSKQTETVSKEVYTELLYNTPIFDI
ncbi:hypothetical protein Tco_1318855 [Tanacetum coccineum]